MLNIDDYFPCFPEGTPIFMHSKKNEIWMSFLEKGMAKIRGGYSELHESTICDGLIDLTGCPIKSISFKDGKVKELLKNDKLWQQLKEYTSIPYILTLNMAIADAESAVRKEASFTILRLVESKGYKLVKIRNLWNFEWTGEWSGISPLWMPDIKMELGYDNDPTILWMSLEDVFHYFNGINICYTRNWQEIRVKGIFSSVIDSTNEVPMDYFQSKYAYTLTVKEASFVVVSIHQNQMSLIHPYDIWVAVLKIVNDGYELIDVTEPSLERQSQLFLKLEKGIYLIYPLTTGCFIRKSSGEPQQLLRDNGQLSLKFSCFIEEIFELLDINNTGELNFTEFKNLMLNFNIKTTNQEFENNILTQYCSTSTGILCRGLKQYLLNVVTAEGEEKIKKYLLSMGIDASLTNTRSRMFVISVHSDQETEMVSSEATIAGTYQKVNSIILQKNGKEIDRKKEASALMLHFKQLNVYSFGVENDMNASIEAIIDCSSFKTQMFSKVVPLVKQVL